MDLGSIGDGKEEEASALEMSGEMNDTDGCCGVKTFELRQYDTTQWVTTYLELDGLGLGIMKSFKRLYNYINGDNSEGLSLEMNVPVRVTVPLHGSTNNATISLFLPRALSTPPKPKNPTLVLESFPPTSFYVRCFGGYALKSDFEKQSKVLAEALTSLGLPFEEEYGMAAAYNDPLTFFKRHNEVWFRSRNQETR
ncbi:heme-binding protein 2-like isoform X2 [Hyperolius riggenbachi]|uniref:heme-binding protein 2-like isoform X2 n=1 Tax=Hyperolius riggenbachi TaxID=752182 RepID=UPI0035A35F45